MRVLVAGDVVIGSTIHKAIVLKYGATEVCKEMSAHILRVRR